MKILTGLELILNKLEEWEVYASKKINSCEQEIIWIKQLIIRYRKIQIISWRNLLNWKKQLMIEDDFESFTRTIHIIEKQVLDKKMYKSSQKNSMEVELKIFEILDLFIRDSSLGQFQTRLDFINLVYRYFK